MKHLNILIIFCFLLTFFIFPSKIASQNIEDQTQEELVPIENPVENQEDFDPKKMRGIIKSIKVENCFEVLCRYIEVEIITGDKKGQTILSTEEDIDNRNLGNGFLNVGDEVFLLEYNYGEESSFAVTGPVREFPIWVLFGLFVLVAILIAQLQGLGAIGGLVASVVILFGPVTGLTLRGWNPILVGYLGGMGVLVTSLFLSHGLNKKTLIAFISSLVGLIIVSILTLIFINWAKLTGFGPEDAISLSNTSGGNLNMKGILFSSIIIGGIGVLDDITVGQISTMIEIYKMNQNLTVRELFNKAMIVGKDHISSLVNTLFIAYAAASMPAVMLLQSSNASISEIINSDQFAEEIVRAILASMGLILVVPIATFVAAVVLKNKVPFFTGMELFEDKHGHHH